MKNPLRSEAEAFRFLLLTIAYFGAIVIAALVGGTWAGLADFGVGTAIPCRRWRTRSGPSARTRSSSRHIQRAARTGSSVASCVAPESASPCRSPTSSSTSRPSPKSCARALLQLLDEVDERFGVGH